MVPNIPYRLTPLFETMEKGEIPLLIGAKNPRVTVEGNGGKSSV
jgi:hypothetical protein